MTKQKKSDSIRRRIEKIDAKIKACYAESREHAFSSPERDAIWKREQGLFQKKWELERELLHALAVEAGGVENLTVEIVMELSSDARRKWRIQEMHTAGITTVGDALKVDIGPGTHLSHHFMKLEEMLRRARYIIEPTRTGRRVVRKPTWYFKRR